MTISEQIKAARKAKGMSQQQLADAIGSYKSNISEIEKGYNVTAKTLTAIAKALSCNIVVTEENIFK